MVCSGAMLAQQAPQGQAQGQGRGGRGGAQRASAAPLFFKVEWKMAPGQTAQAPVVQENVADPNLELKFYGPNAKKLLTTNTQNPLGTFSGEIDGPFAVTFRHKNNFVDLSGLSKIRWAVRTSGFHPVRPVVKLADGTLLVGDRATEATPMLTEVEFSLSGVRWVALDPARVVTTNSPAARGGGINEIWVRNPDLTKVDEVGFADLVPASGHGLGGVVIVAGIEVYGQPVPR
jgi:hypothetical protein